MCPGIETEILSNYTKWRLYHWLWYTAKRGAWEMPLEIQGQLLSSADSPFWGFSAGMDRNGFLLVTERNLQASWIKDTNLWKGKKVLNSWILLRSVVLMAMHETPRLSFRLHVASPLMTRVPTSNGVQDRAGVRSMGIPESSYLFYFKSTSCNCFLYLPSSIIVLC